ncbi:MAG: hypothetical protein RIR10_1570 [Planctomycetota bacterium]|jgi:outer membrane protein TolC
MKSIDLRVALLARSLGVQFALLGAIAATSACAPRRDASPSIASSKTATATDERVPFQPTTIDDVVRRALQNSHRIQEAEALFAASQADLRADLAPPDPVLALSLGIPVDGMGGDAFSASLMSGISWVFNRDALQSEAEARIAEKARALVALSAEVAAEARHLARVALSTTEANDAAMTHVAALAALLRSEESAAMLGEARADAPVVARATLREAERAYEVRRQSLALAHARLASLLSLEEAALDLSHLAATIRTSIAAVPEAPREDAPQLEAPSVIAARVRVAEAQRSLQRTMHPFSIDDGVGAGFSRDLEGRESVNLMFALELPLFRQSHEVAGARSRVDAAEAALAEAMRVSHLERRERVRALESAVTQLEFAREATRASNIAITSMRAAYDAGEISGMTLQKALAEHAVRMQATSDATIHESEARAAYERALLTDIATRQPKSRDHIAHDLVAHDLVAHDLVAQSTQARVNATGDAP